MTIDEKIRLLARRRGFGIAGLARALGCSTQNIYLKLKRGNWTEGELAEYANALDCDIEITFIDRNTGERL